MRYRTVKDSSLNGASRVRICVCTTNSADAEPRAPRHAVALATLMNNFEVVFVDCVPQGQSHTLPKIFEGLPNLTLRTCFFPYKDAQILDFVFAKITSVVSKEFFRRFGFLHPSALSTRALKLERLLNKIDADIFVGYNIDALLPVYRVGHKKNALIVFDCHEFYSDMGDWQTPVDRRLIQAVERKCLPGCDLVLAASDQMAEEFSKAYGIKRPLTLYNVPPKEEFLRTPKENSFSLYWRNLTIDVGQRGLADAILALTLLPEDIFLHVQGKLPSDGGEQMRRTIHESGVAKRVVIHPPYEPHEAVTVAAAYTVGLCLEQAGNRNHEVTVSNKMFDYLMAGLPVIASDLPGLRDIVERSKAGLLYRSGDHKELAEKIMALYEDRKMLIQLSANARNFALAEGNLEHEMAKLVAGFDGFLDSRRQDVSGPNATEIESVPSAF